MPSRGRIPCDHPQPYVVTDWKGVPISWCPDCKEHFVVWASDEPKRIYAQPVDLRVRP